MLLNKYLPQNLTETKTFTSLLNSEQIEVDEINTSITDIVNQCFVNTATWGLEFWENFLGIKTDKTKDVDYRRTVINAKLRGAGTITLEVFENVANSFKNGKVKVIEHPELYSFEVKFIDAFGIPPNMIDLQNAINDIKPAHLIATYSFSYFLIKDIDKVMTIAALQATLLNKFVGGA